MYCKLANDGFNPKLVENVRFDGKYEMPLIRNQDIKGIDKLIPFDKRKLYKSENVAIHFYIYDTEFRKIINNPEKYKNELKNFGAVISPDFSLYYDMPLATQISNTYLNRAIGAFYQSNGIKVIPNVRWSDTRSYDFCFDGLEKGGIYAIGSYGQIKKKVNRYYFEKGLEEFFKRLKPKVVYIYGTMPKAMFEKYKNKAKLLFFEPYTSKVHRGAI